MIEEMNLILEVYGTLKKICYVTLFLNKKTDSKDYQKLKRKNNSQFELDCKIVSIFLKWNYNLNRI